MLDIFDILGPVMVGPSSSHTAGAVRIGRMARTLLGGAPVKADIGLYGSFAETGRGCFKNFLPASVTFNKP